MSAGRRAAPSRRQPLTEAVAAAEPQSPPPTGRGPGGGLMSDPQREQGNRRIAIGLALFAAALFISFLIFGSG